MISLLVIAWTTLLFCCVRACLLIEKSTNVDNMEILIILILTFSIDLIMLIACITSNFQPFK